MQWRLNVFDAPKQALFAHLNLRELDSIHPQFGGPIISFSLYQYRIHLTQLKLPIYLDKFWFKAMGLGSHIFYLEAEPSLHQYAVSRRPLLLCNCCEKVSGGAEPNNGLSDVTLNTVSFVSALVIRMECERWSMRWRRRRTLWMRAYGVRFNSLKFE